MEILIFKNLNLIEKSEIETVFYSEIISQIKNLMEIKAALKEKEYKKSLDLTINGKKINLIIRLVLNNLDKFNIIFEIGNKQEKLIKLEEFNLSKNNFEKLSQIKNYNNGIFIFSGSVISGKNELVFSLIDKLFDEREIKVFEPFDKYENYIEVINNILPNFEKNKKNIVIFNISEKEKFPKELINLASDYMIFINITGNNTPETIKKLFEMEIISKDHFEDFKLLIFQKFVKKLCDHCKKKYKADASVLNELFNYHESSQVYFYKKDACKACFNTGFSGKLAIQEVLLAEELDISFANFSKSADEKKYSKFIQENEYNDIKYDCIKKVLRGLTDINEFYNI
jgi:type IV pilus assembly protein PilB